MENQVKQRSEASSLESFREQIDSVDREILRLFEKRMEISEGIARVKSATGRKVYDKEREAAKRKALAENPANWELCAERCRCYCQGECACGCTIPPQLRERPIAPEECAGFQRKAV
jgi:chorismate mutase